MKKNMSQAGFKEIGHVECPVTYALKMIGGKWKLPVLWHLYQKESIRYNELKRHIPGITNMMLSKTLKELEENGLVRRIQYDQVPPKVEYQTTARGLALLPALKALYKWAEEQITYTVNV